MGLLLRRWGRRRYHGSPFERGGVIEDTMGLRIMEVEPLLKGGAMEGAMGICIWGGGYRKRQSSSLILVGPKHV